MPELEISNIEYFVIAGYLALIITVGLSFKKFSSNTDDYFKGGSIGTWWLVGSSAFMSTLAAASSACVSERSSDRVGIWVNSLRWDPVPPLIYHAHFDRTVHVFFTGPCSPDHFVHCSTT